MYSYFPRSLGSITVYGYGTETVTEQVMDNLKRQFPSLEVVKQLMISSNIIIVSGTELVLKLQVEGNIGSAGATIRILSTGTDQLTDDKLEKLKDIIARNLDTEEPKPKDISGKQKLSDLL